MKTRLIFLILGLILSSFGMMTDGFGQINFVQDSSRIRGTACVTSFKVGFEGGVPPYTASWVCTAGSPSWDTVTNLYAAAQWPNTTPSPWNVRCTVKDAVGDSMNHEFTGVTINPFTVSLSLQHVDCSHSIGKVRITPSSTQLTYAYLHVSGGGGQLINWGPPFTQINLPIGYHRLIIYGDGWNGCTILDTVFVIEDHRNMTLSTTFANGQCPNSYDATTTVTGGTPPYSYTWSTGATTQTVTCLLPCTNYIVTVSDASGCQKVDTMVQTPSLVMNTSIFPSGQCLGSYDATVSPTGGVPPYVYLWSTGPTTQTATCLSPLGTYYVTVADAGSCTSIDTLDMPLILETDHRGVGGIVIAPNPSTGSFTISIPNLGISDGEVVTLKLHDLQGRVLHQEVVPTITNFSHEVSAPLTKGLYLLRVEVGGNVSTHKVLIE